MLKGSVADRILLFEKMPDQIDEPKSQKSPPKEILVSLSLINRDSIISALDTERAQTESVARGPEGHDRQSTKDERRYSNVALV